MNPDENSYQGYYINLNIARDLAVPEDTGTRKVMEMLEACGFHVCRISAHRTYIHVTGEMVLPYDSDTKEMHMLLQVELGCGLRSLWVNTEWLQWHHEYTNP